MHPGWRVNLERELALCSDVPVSLLQQPDETAVATDAAYLMSIVRRINGAAPPQIKAQGMKILANSDLQLTNKT